MLGIAADTISELANAISEGKSNSEIAATFVSALGKSTIVYVVSTMAGAAAGTLVAAPLGTLAGVAGGLLVGSIVDNVLENPEEWAKQELTKIFDLVLK